MSQLSPVKINAITFPHHSFCLQVCHSWQLQQRCQDLVLNLLIGLFFPLVNWHEITAGDNRTEELSVRWERGGGRKRGQGGVMCPSGYMSDSMREALQSTLRLPQKWIHISSIAPLLAGQQKLSVLFMQSRGSRSGPFHVSLIFKFFIPVTILSCMAITKISLVTMKFWQLLHSHVLNSDSQPRDQGSSFHLLYDWKSVAVKSKCGSTHLSSDGILKHSGGRTFHTRNVRFVFCWHPPANIKKQTQCECAQVIWFLSSPSPTSNT